MPTLAQTKVVNHVRSSRKDVGCHILSAAVVMADMRIRGGEDAEDTEAQVLRYLGAHTSLTRRPLATLAQDIIRTVIAERDGIAGAATFL